MPVVDRSTSYAASLVALSVHARSMRVGEIGVAVSPEGSAGGGGKVTSNGELVPQLQLVPFNVPVMVPPAELAILSPESSFMPQRPTRPVVAPVSCELMVDWIWACVRATFQMRASSSKPLKN